MFVIGDTAEALLKVNIRQAPGYNGKITGQLQPGDRVRIVSDARILDSLVWWPTQQGWVADTASDGTPLLQKYEVQSSWTKAISFVLAHEGGYVDDPRDSGGETNWGISKRSYPNVDIKNLTRNQAIGIYERDFWMASGSDKLDWPLCLIHFNASVNCGVGQAHHWLWASDGNPYRYMALQLEFYTNINGWATFSKGWTRRMASLLKECAS